MEQTLVDDVEGLPTGSIPLHTPPTRLHESAPSINAPSLSSTLGNVAFALSTTAPHIALSPAPRLPNPSNSFRGKPRRPSTASSAEEKYTRLPSSSSSPVDLSSTAISTPSLGSQDGDNGSSLDGSERPSLHEVNRRAIEAVAGLRAEASRLAGAGEYFIVMWGPVLY